MPSTIESYLKDTTIDQTKRANMAAKLDAGEWSESDAEAAISRKYGSKYTTAPTPSLPAQPKVQERPWYNPDPAIVAKGAAEMGGQVVAETGRALGNTVAAAGSLLDMANPQLQMENQVRKSQGLPENKVLGTVGDAIKGFTDSTADSISTTQKTSGFNPDSDASTGGKVIGTVIGQIPALMVGGEVTRGLGAGGSLLKNIGANMAGGAVSTEMGVAATDGRLANPAELASGGAIDLGSTLISRGLGKLSASAYNKVLGLTRGEQGKLSKRGLDLGKALSEQGHVSFTKEGLARKIGTDIKALADNLDGLIKRADAGDSTAIVNLGQKTGITAGDLIVDLRKKVLANPKLKPKFGDVKAVEGQISKALNEFNDAVGSSSKALTLEQVQAIKKKLGGSLSALMARSGDARATANELVNDVIRKNAKNIIEANVAGAKGLNQKMEPLIEAKKVLQKKGNYSGLLTNSLVGGAALSGGIAQGKNPIDILRDVGIGVLGKNILQSSTGRMLRGRILQGASKIMPAIAQTAKTVTRTKTLAPTESDKKGAAALGKFTSGLIKR